MRYSKTEFLMWTDITITIVTDKNPLEDIYNCLSIFYSLEIEFSRFIETSSLSLLNSKKELEVSDRFIDVFLKSCEIYKKTKLFFNPLVNLNNIWYSKNFLLNEFKKEENKEDLDLDRVSIIWNFITLKENQNLDLWWIVKWYSVDLVTDYLKEKWYKDFIINAWWDIYISWNNHLWKTPTVAIDDPFDKENIFATLELKDKSISTSWTYKRKWNINNEDFHHIINPKSGKNNNEIISISIISNKCYISDSYATACIAMWIKESLEFLEKKNLDWIILWNDKNVYKTKNISNYNLKVF